MSRCKSCDTILLRNPGWISLDDGTKVPEDLCPECRNYALAPVDERVFAHQDITEYGFIYAPNGVTRPAPVET